MIIVTGACYTGTSIVAGTLHRLGVSMGENTGSRYEDARFASFDHITLHAILNNSVGGFKHPYAYQWLDKVIHLLKDAHFIYCSRDVYKRHLDNPQKYNERSIFEGLSQQAEWANFFLKHNITPLIIDFELSQQAKIDLLCTTFDLTPTPHALEFYNKQEGYR